MSLAVRIFLALALVVAVAECGVTRAYSLRPYPGDCDSFYSCVSFKCPAGMVFNPDTLRCEDSLRHRVSAVKPRDETTMFPDSNDPSIYWECTRMPCPVGLEFNPVKLTCDDPMTAGCKA